MNRRVEYRVAVDYGDIMSPWIASLDKAEMEEVVKLNSGGAGHPIVQVREIVETDWEDLPEVEANAQER